MHENEEEAPGRMTVHEVGMSLDTMSLDELAERLTLLEKEIGRVRAAIEARHSSRSAADAFFKR